MNYRSFGNTDLKVSAIGFGAWTIGGHAMAGDIPIGWGDTDDATSRRAIQRAIDEGINFFDTADFYGLGHSEELLGEALAPYPEALIATKVGHRLAEDQSIFTDYTKDWIREACHASLRRLRRDRIDYYQLHTAKAADLERGECVEAMEKLRAEGKIRYWGLSLNTFNPFPEAEYMLEHGLGSGFQVVFNIINQRALSIMERAAEQGYGIIARMPLQFGLLAGKYTVDTRFAADDHRSFRLHPELLARSLESLEPIWPLAEELNISPVTLSLRYILSFSEVSTVIPGIRTPEQAADNVRDVQTLPDSVVEKIRELYKEDLHLLLAEMEKRG
jgi:aryl-alcohol dehydrogenase-like predicted oxidoreductase